MCSSYSSYYLIRCTNSKSLWGNRTKLTGNSEIIAELKRETSIILLFPLHFSLYVSPKKKRFLIGTPHCSYRTIKYVIHNTLYKKYEFCLYTSHFLVENVTRTIMGCPLVWSRLHFAMFLAHCVTESHSKVPNRFTFYFSVAFPTCILLNCCG